MNILLLGSGGRESALAWKMAQSPMCDTLYVAPGNAGTGAMAVNLPAVKATDFAAVADIVARHNIGMVVVGPEEPLVKGLREALARTCPGVLVLGPGADGARIEGSKDFAKEFMGRHGIPTAAHLTVTADTLNEGLAFVRSLRPPYVLKADGLAAGKGVVITSSLQEADAVLRGMLSGSDFGDAGRRVVIEQFLDGVECSVFVLTDGAGNWRVLPVAKDYKRALDGDLGPNTGGMGSVSPVPFADAAFMAKVEERIVHPTIEGLIKEGIDYRGFIFLGLMNVGGDPYVIEYNARMGDPETETVMRLIDGDLTRAMAECAAGQLKPDTRLATSPQAAATVIITSQGYPGPYAKGRRLTVDEAALPADAVLFHAGTRLDAPSGDTLTDGGRVMAASATAPTLDEALQKAYAAARAVAFDGATMRGDIGADMLTLIHKAEG